MSTQISVVSVPVSDVDRAKHFYSEVLDFDVVMDNSFGAGAMRWVMLRPTGGGTAITLVTWFDTMKPGSLNGSVLAVDNLEEAVAQYTARGLALADGGKISAEFWGRWVSFTDPDGNAWVLQQDAVRPATPPAD